MGRDKQVPAVIHLIPKNPAYDPVGLRVSALAGHEAVLRTRLFLIDYPLTGEEIELFARRCLADPVIEDAVLGTVRPPDGYASYILVARHKGVTDDEGQSVQQTLADFLHRKLPSAQFAYSQELYFFKEHLSREESLRIGRTFLGNSLIHRIQSGPADEVPLEAPGSFAAADTTVETINLELPDEELMALSYSRVLSLNLEEMHAIQSYYRRGDVRRLRDECGLPPAATDCELEILAQTWSEHCKHKEFAAEIHYTNLRSGTVEIIDSLFQTFIRGATQCVRRSLEEGGNRWLLSVFSDNAGVVALDSERAFVWKVETHNSPSAIEPYGGALTGILGNNRDIMGTGMGGARLMFNTNVLCFAPPDYEAPLLPGQLHPRHVMAGVIRGIEDGGNKSGVPTVNGAIVFDERFAGKPLVFCGTGGIMPRRYQGCDSSLKPIAAGDRIMMAGGRVGKDGIHGATFSSAEVSENSPTGAVQIGSPITQKMLADFLEHAARRGLLSGITDNGAGGLSSSVGELARIPNGASVELAHVPLKYPGLRPWEIFLSESQERMTLAVPLENIRELEEMAERMDVELSDIGAFTADGTLEVRCSGRILARLELEFLHDGVPRKHLEAEWEPGGHPEPELPEKQEYNKELAALLARPNIASREPVIRRYDHEVKGTTVVKPLMAAGNSPQDAAVVRVDYESWMGVAVANGIIPRYGDVDAYQMSAGAFDEAVRQIIAVGGMLPNTEENDGRFWSVNDNFCVPDSVYHPASNPDGRLKLGKLVEMCRALYDSSVAFDIPMTSGKDSMKNDFIGGGQKISVPPTVLYSIAARIDDVRRMVTTTFKAPGDLIYLAGETYDELGASEYYAMLGHLGCSVPIVRRERARKLYLRIMAANREQLIQSCHDLSDGGLAAAAAECTFGSNLGAEISLESMEAHPPHVLLFSESHSRFIISIRPADREPFEELLGSRAALLGEVSRRKHLVITHNGQTLIDQAVDKLTASWEGGLFE